MLTARKPSIWKQHYDISADGTPLTTWNARMWKNGGSFELWGRAFEVGANMWGSKYGMSTKDGAEVAKADRVGRKHWTVQAGGRTYEFSRTSAWKREQALLDASGRQVGSVRRPSTWRTDVEADLPGLPPEVAVFVLVVVLTMWDQQDSAAAAT